MGVQSLLSYSAREKYNSSQVHANQNAEQWEDSPMDGMPL